MIDTTAGSATRRPTKFMADLSRAMQTAAEVSRDETMARLSAEVKTVVEEIHAASTVEAAALRRRADDDVAAVREWSKAEIARIRDETEARIATRKVALDGEMDAHGKVVEARVEQVTATVSEFEAEMAAFFERLLAEQDPTRIATMAEAMPDPPDLAGVAAAISEPPTGSFDPNAAGAAGCPGRRGRAETAARRAGSIGRAGSVGRARPTTTPDFAAAEAEAAAFSGDLGEDDELRQPAVATESDAPESADPTARRPPARRLPATRRPARRRPRRPRTSARRPVSSSSDSSASRASRPSSAASGAPAVSAASRWRPVPTASSSSPSTTTRASASPTRSPGCPGSRHGSPPRPPTASRSPHTTPTPPADDPELEESPVARPAVVVALPPTESGSSALSSAAPASRSSR